jgi:hypothetical protein
MVIDLRKPRSRWPKATQKLSTSISLRSRFPSQPHRLSVLVLEDPSCSSRLASNRLSGNRLATPNEYSDARFRTLIFPRNQVVSKRNLQLLDGAVAQIRSGIHVVNSARELDGMSRLTPLQDQELACLHRSAQAPRLADDLVRSQDDLGGQAHWQAWSEARLQ